MELLSKVKDAVVKEYWAYCSLFSVTVDPSSFVFVMWLVIISPVFRRSQNGCFIHDPLVHSFNAFVAPKVHF